MRDYLITPPHANGGERRRVLHQPPLRTRRALGQDPATARRSHDCRPDIWLDLIAVAIFELTGDARIVKRVAN